MKVGPKPTNEEFHSELMDKVNSPNRSLKPARLRSLPDQTPQTLPEWKKIFNEFLETKENCKKRQTDTN